MFDSRLYRRLAPAAVCLLLGLLLAIQFRTQEKVRLTGRSARIPDEMIAQLLEVTRERERLRVELRRLQEMASVHLTQAELQDELLRGLASAGLVEVRGPGVMVIISDRTATSSSARAVTPDDVMLLLHELRAGGAEAIAVNGQRATALLTISRPQGRRGPLHVGAQYVDGPVRLEAVGDPAVLAAALLMRGGIVQQLAPWLRIEVTESPWIVVPASAAPPAFTFARPVR